ncbi:MAG: hypothetical protein JNK90_09690 [Planctomycetaceae bacterium]|nr:hypothetical protein [Planctomycetaceae bacterium]MBN8600480.1 hypothetical protein [Planctomycetota bacterium]
MRKTIAVITALLLVAWIGYLASGTRFSGAAAKAADIPIVGELLTELDFARPANFTGFEHPHGGGTFTITGTTTPESMAKFCNRANVSLSQDGTELQNRADILNHLEIQKVPLVDSIILDPNHQVLFSYGDRFRKLYGVYSPTTQEFAITVQFDSSR